MPKNYYNEIDPYAAQWLRNLIAADLIASGEVDERSILDVRADDLKSFTQCHFFAGIGGWSDALRLAGWPDERPVWTGSCPCQPFSAAGKRKGFDDDRHLWPAFRFLISERRPATVFGEQVASATEWLGLVRSDLENLDYAVGAIPIEAASAGADHLRDRYWFVGHDTRIGRGEGWSKHAIRSGRNAATSNGRLADDQGEQVGTSRQSRQSGDVGDRNGARADAHATEGSPRATVSESGCRSRDLAENHPFEWAIGADGKARRVKPGVRLLAHGIPNRVAKLRGFGNAIDPRPAAQFIGAFMECRP